LKRIALGSWGRHKRDVSAIGITGATGAVLGILATLGQIVRQRREIGVLKRELDAQRGPAAEAPADIVES